MNRTLQAESTAEAFAASFLDDAVFGHRLFIGAHIERLLAKKVNLIYQFIEDEEFFGAAITHEKGEEFISLNSYHPLRMRYFTAAHELWHLSEGSKIQGKEFDHERAADRFAAAIMLPKILTKELWNKFVNDYGAEEAVIHIADLAAVPYLAVVRRIKELGEKIKLSSCMELDWVEKRKELGLPPSPLDQPMPITRFEQYKYVVKESVEKRGLDKLAAANKLISFAKELSEEYQTDALQSREKQGET